DDAGLRGRVGDAAGAGADARHRGGADDRALAVRPHHLAGVLDGQERPDEVDPQHLGPALGRDLVDRPERAARRADAGVGVDRVEPAELGDGARDVRFDVVFLAGVAGHRHRLAARVADRLGGLLDRLGAVHADHRRAFAGEELGGGAADAARRPGHHRRSSIQPAHAVLPHFKRLLAASSGVASAGSSRRARLRPALRAPLTMRWSAVRPDLQGASMPALKRKPAPAPAPAPTPAGERVPIARPRLPTRDAIGPYLDRIDAARWYTNHGPLVRELESRLAARLAGGAGVVTVANGTIALTLALKAAGAKPGTLCVMPAWTFVASPHAA